MEHIDKKQKKEKDEAEVKKTPPQEPGQERERVLALIPKWHNSQIAFSKNEWGPLGGATTETLLRVANGEENNDSLVAAPITWLIDGATALHLARAEAASSNQAECTTGIPALLKGVMIAKVLIPTIMDYIGLPRVLILRLSDCDSVHPVRGRFFTQHHVICTDEWTPHAVFEAVMAKENKQTCALCEKNTDLVMMLKYPNMRDHLKMNLDAPMSRQPLAVATSDVLDVIPRQRITTIARRWKMWTVEGHGRPKL